MVHSIFYKILLSPFAFLYFIITWVRNKLYDYQVISSYLPDVYTLCIGNLAVGGTGKSPMVEYLVEILKNNFKIAVLSRGYGRATNGFIEADESSNAEIIGDEPYQYYLKYKHVVPVFVGEKRVAAFKKIIQLLPNLEALILDDAFQHRAILAHQNIVLTDFNNLIYNDLILPIGQLREGRHGLNRAQIVIVSKCPSSLSEYEAKQIEHKFHEISNSISVFFTKIEYGQLVQFNGLKPGIVNSAILVSGIANSSLFESYCKANWQIIEHLKYKDHYKYTTNDIKRIASLIADNEAIITTEKDFVKLVGHLPETINAFYLPIKVEFMFGQSVQFEKLILNDINEFYKK